MERALEIVDRRIREVLAASNQFKRDGKDADMFRCNTAFHWLDAVRRDIIEAIDAGEIDVPEK